MAMDKKSQSQPLKQDISLVFLDVDGVLNINGSGKRKMEKSTLRVLRTHVERLKDIIKSTNIECKICISSAWRLHKYALQFLKKQLIAMGEIDVENTIIAQTSSIPFNKNIQSFTQQRISEIRSYLSHDEALKSQYNVISFCVIDDMDLSGIGCDHFVHIDPKQGITETNVHQILSILNPNSQSTRKLTILKSKPSIKLLFIAAQQNNYKDINTKRLQIIQKKTECTLVMAKPKHADNTYNNSLTIENFTQITKYTTDLEQTYNIQSWAVLDYINIFQQYKDQPTLITRRFIKVDPHTDLSINHVLDTVSILNKWS